MLSSNPHRWIQTSRNVTIKYSGANTGAALQFAQMATYLRAHFDENLTWQAHIEYVSEKLRTVSSSTYTIRSAFFVNLKIRVYEAIGQSIIRYGWNVHALCSNYKRPMINKTLKRTSRNVIHDTSHGKKTFNWRPNVKDTRINYRQITWTSSMGSKLFFKCNRRKA